MTRLGTTLSILAALLLSNVLAQGGSCSGGGAARKAGGTVTNEKLASGVWGGAHVRMEVGEGGVNFEFDCAAGNVNRPVVLDAEGRFDVKGTFIAQHAGPVRRDEEANARPVRYSGRVRGETLTLTVSLGGAEEEVSSYTLTRGDEGRLTKCR